MIKLAKENPFLTLFIVGAILFVLWFLFRNKKGESSYTRYNDKNFPGLVSKSDMPRDTGNPIADIQLIRMAEANPKLARTIES